MSEQRFIKFIHFAICIVLIFSFVTAHSKVDTKAKSKKIAAVKPVSKPSSSSSLDTTKKRAQKPTSKPKPAPTPTPPPSACELAYENVFRRSVVNISVLFGYKDTRPARFVGDRHERLSFVQTILKPCLKNNQACGFERSPKNADLFFKKHKGVGAKPITIQLKVVNSSAGSDDQANKTDPFQEWQSTYARETFLSGIKDSDVVFYNGHSRFGGGPDFQPPQLNDKGEVDAPYYQSQKPGFMKTLDVIQVQSFTKGAVGGRMKIFGLFSCGSSQHFTDEIQQYSGVGLISSKKLIYYADALENSLIAMNSFLQMKCLKEFNSSLHNGNTVRGMKLQGFLSE